MLTAVILTQNEALHIERCIESLHSVASRVVVVDSGSSDGTCELARKLGAHVYENVWVNYATQFNWALDHADIDTPWVCRIDADEFLTEELQVSIQSELVAAAADVVGFTVNRLMCFGGRPMRHGAVYPRKMLRIFRFGLGRVESRWMDEHIQVSGRVHHIAGDLIDDNKNGLTFWTAKHNSYASREVADILLTLDQSVVQPSNLQARLIRFGKKHIYERLPAGLRPFPYFFYRYILRLGFLDGPQGLDFHVLQGFWYRFLVDAKLKETLRIMQEEQLSARQAIERLHGLRIPQPTPSRTPETNAHLELT